MSAAKHHNKRLILLDSHAIIHRAYHALPDFATSTGEPTGALYGLMTMLIKLIADLKPDYIAACFDLPAPTHRHDAYKEYKGTRKKIDDALIAQIERSKDVFKAFGIPVYSVKGFEADDALGTIVEKISADPDTEIIIATGDMDTLQLVSGNKVRVFTLRKGITDTVLYNEDMVKERYGFGPEHIPDYKGLSGDPSDNIIGIPGIGDKTATTLIQTFGTIEAMYDLLKKDAKKFAARAEEAGIKERIVKLITEHEDEARFSKMLATVRRDAPIDFVLPEKTWDETIDLGALEALCKQLEFRTLFDRVKTVVAKKNVKDAATPHDDKKPAPVPKKTSRAKSESTEIGAPTLYDDPAQAVDPVQFEKAALGVWVLDSNISTPDLTDILQYTNTDSFEDAQKVIEKKLSEGKVGEVYKNIELPLMPVIKKMEDCGVLIDTKYLAGLSKDYHKKLDALEKKIWDMTGQEFNINSPKQLSEVLFEKLKLGAGSKAKSGKSGVRSTKESELEKLREESPVIELILEYRELQKLLSTYIDAIPERLDVHNRLHAKFVQTGTTTGRISSQAPNMQNIPIKTELGRNIRHAFIAGEKFSLAALDYSQIELRIAAFLSRDQVLIDIFKSGGDVHAGVASRVFGVPEDKVDREMRRRAKVINFGIIYGMGINALRANLGTSRDEAKQFYDAYFQNFSALSQYLEDTKALAAKQGYTETFFGRRRYFPGMRSKLPFIRAASERMAINAPIQGTGADIMKLAMIHVDEYLEKNGFAEDAHLILTVHDELVYEIRDSKVAELVPQIRKIMESVLTPEHMLGVPLKVEAEVGKNWGEMEEV